MNNRKKVIGVTGSLAAGKTTVTDEFVSLGAVRVDADAIAHELLSEDDEIKEKVLKVFGRKVMDSNAVNRRKLAAEVFSDRDKLDKLCAIMHPKILERIKREISDARGDVVVVDAPLLFESGLASEMDLVIVVAASQETRIKRAVLRGVPEMTARSIMEKQMSQEEKIKKADHVIINEDEIEKIKEGVKKVWQKK